MVLLHLAALQLNDKGQIIIGTQHANPAECFEDSEGIFPVNIRGEIKKEQKGERTFGDLKMPPAEKRFQMNLPCKRHMHDRLGHSSRNRGICEFRRSPNLVKAVELSCPLLRIPAQLPHWIDYVVRITRQIRC